MGGRHMKTETLYYIKKFRLDQENFQFRRQEFIDDLSKKFLEQVNNYPEKNPKTNCITYKNFKGILDYYGEVKDEINAAVGNKITQGLWNAFYAQTVIPIRKVLFPRVQDKINTYKVNTIGNLAILKHL